MGARTRSGWAYTFAVRPRSNPTSVMPHSRRCRTARPVGRETAASSGDPEHRRLLHQLETRATGHDEKSARRVDAPARQRAQHLVQRVVPADVLAHHAQLAVRRGPRRRVHRVRGLVEGLARVQRGPRPPQRLRLDGERRGHHTRRPHGIVDRLDAAQPAAGSPRDRPRPLRQPLDGLGGNLDRQLHAAAVRRDARPAGSPRARPTINSLSVNPTARSSRSVGRGHHHRVRPPRVHERDGHFLGHRRPVLARAILAEAHEPPHVHRLPVPEPRNGPEPGLRISVRHAPCRSPPRRPLPSRRPSRTATRSGP